MSQPSVDQAAAFAGLGPTWYISRSLRLGDVRAVPGGTIVDGAVAAVEVMRAGGVAVLPAGAWDAADEALWLLDLSRGWREHVLHWARTGHVARPVATTEHPAEPAPRQPAIAAGSGSWPDPPDGEKAGPLDLLLAELSTLEQTDPYRHEAVVRFAKEAAGLGMHPDDALRRAMDETAADDELFYAKLAERLNAPDCGD